MEAKKEEVRKGMLIVIPRAPWRLLVSRRCFRPLGDVISFTIKSSLTGFALLGLAMQATLRSLGACGPPQATPRTMLLRCHRHGHLQATQHDKVRPTGKRENRSLSNPVASDSQSWCQVRLSHDVEISRKAVRAQNYEEAAKCRAEEAWWGFSRLRARDPP